MSRSRQIVFSDNVFRSQIKSDYAHSTHTGENVQNKKASYSVYTGGAPFDMFALLERVLSVREALGS